MTSLHSKPETDIIATREEMGKKQQDGFDKFLADMEERCHDCRGECRRGLSRSITVGKNLGINSVCGYRFCPKDHELVMYYLIPKIMCLQLPMDIIEETEVYKSGPDQLPIGEFRYGYPEEAYFFTQKQVIGMHSNKLLTKRTTDNGYWKATGREAEVMYNKKIVGFKKTMVFYHGKGPTGRRSNWVMHEYRVNALLYPFLQENEDMKDKVACTGGTNLMIYKFDDLH